jgi:hypothetical protein
MGTDTENLGTKPSCMEFELITYNMAIYPMIFKYLFNAPRSSLLSRTTLA